MPHDGPDSVREWWDACHAGTHPQTDFFLTGHQGPEVWQSLDVLPWLLPGTAVLNIGVGKGYCTRHLAERGCLVSALDISPLALAKVADVIQAGYLAEALQELPAAAFDLALSFLVAQHMDHAALAAQLAAVGRALKPGGLFALQYAFALDPAAPPRSEDSPETCQVGGVLRRRDTMEAMTREAGLRVLRSWEDSRYPDYGSGWGILHLAPSEAPA